MRATLRALVLAAAITTPLAGCGKDQAVVQPCALALVVYVDPPTATVTSQGQRVTYTAGFGATGCASSMKRAFDWSLSQPAVGTIVSSTDTSATIEAVAGGTTSVIATAREKPAVKAAGLFIFNGHSPVPPTTSARRP